MRWSLRRRIACDDAGHIDLIPVATPVVQTPKCASILQSKSVAFVSHLPLLTARPRPVERSSHMHSSAGCMHAFELPAECSDRYC